MTTFFLGPALLAVGFGFVHFSIHGLHAPLFGRRQPRQQKVEFGAEDRLLGEVLSEMLNLRDELEAVKVQLSAATAARKSSRRVQSVH